MSQTMPEKIFQLVVVEDNAADTFLIERSLRNAGLHYNLRTFEDGASALAFVNACTAETEPDLMVVDLNLPRVSGKQIVRALRRSRFLRNVLTFVISSSPSPHDRLEIEHLGARFVTKPDNLSDFMQIGRDLKAALERTVGTLGS